MPALRLFLLLATLAIYAVTVVACIGHGVNWPAVAIADLQAGDWRSQFDVDFIVYLLLGAVWISWREGFTAKGHLFAVLSVVMGGMFSFPYVLWATYLAKGDPKAVLLGVRER